MSDVTWRVVIVLSFLPFVVDLTLVENSVFIVVLAVGPTVVLGAAAPLTEPMLPVPLVQN